MSQKRAIAFITHPLAVLSLAILAMLANSAAAAIIHLGNGSGNTMAPADDPGWDYVGEFKSGSAIYLGNRWVITANHLGSGSTMTLLGESFNVVAGSEQTLRNPPASGLTTFTDLKLFQIDRDPGLPPLAISQVLPEVGAEVVMIGRGRNRETDVTLFDIDTSAPSPIWNETSDLSQADASGYRYATGQTMRWGTNRIEDDTVYRAWDVDPNHNMNVSIRIGEKSFDVVAFVTKFDDTGGTAFEAQAAFGDSGGAVFYNNFPDEADAWELAGVIHAVDNSRGQPYATAVLGNLTFFSDLSVYRDQIKAITSAVAPVPISLDSTGQTYFQDFNDLGAVGSVLPDGWVTRNGPTTNLTVTQPYPATSVVNGTYNAGSGDDRTLATGNTDREAANAIMFSGRLTGPLDVRAIVFQSRIEAWHGDMVTPPDDPGEAAFVISLQFDPEHDGTFTTAHTFNGGDPVTTGTVLQSGPINGTGVTFFRPLLELPTAIPAGSDIRVTFDSRGVGQTQGYIFGVDDFLFRIVAPGDTDGDGDVDSKDMLAIQSGSKFNNPDAGPASWKEGDFNGDDQVTSDDLFLITGDATLVDPTRPWHNPINRWDVNGDGYVSPIDALIIVNHLKNSGSDRLIDPSGGETTEETYPDVSGDNFISPIDVLLVVNHLNDATLPAALATVPEPSTFVLAVFGLLALVMVGRYRRFTNLVEPRQLG